MDRRSLAESEAPYDFLRALEESIGRVTPLLAEQLRMAEATYPVDWLKEAMKQAVVYNKRSWCYMEMMLERWAHEGGLHDNRLKGYRHKISLEGFRLLLVCVVPTYK